MFSVGCEFQTAGSESGSRQPEHPADIAIVGNEQEVERKLRAVADAGATELLATIFPVGDNAAASVARTRALLKSLLGKM